MIARRETTSEVVPRALPLPAPRVGVTVRAGTADDLPFVDALQKRHGKQLGFMNRPTLEGKVALGHVLVAEAVGGGQRAVGRAGTATGDASALPTSYCLPPTLAGYLIGNDRYKHRDELGVIFQLCVAPEYRRSLVAAHLLRAQFERSAYGCRLYCCWYAQDLEANRFWEGMGFVPIAFRAGGATRDRVHVFWQKRIRAGDATTPWWFPSQTSGGLMDAARAVLPIPPGVRWSDELPRLLPEATAASSDAPPPPPPSATEKKPKAPPAKPHASGGLWFVRAPAVDEAAEKPKRQPPPKRNALSVAAKARELRDRWLEAVNAGRFVPVSDGKYDVSRAVDGTTAGPAAGPWHLAGAARGPATDDPALPAPRAA